MRGPGMRERCAPGDRSHARVGQIHLWFPVSFVQGTPRFDPGRNLPMGLCWADNAQRSGSYRDSPSRYVVFRP